MDRVHLGTSIINLKNFLKQWVQYGITFNSGTGTLQAGLSALGVGYGDEVITTPLTVISNLYVILSLNAIPSLLILIKILLILIPNQLKKKKKLAIMPVALYGLPCDLEKINKISKKFKIPVLLDAAEAHLATINKVSIAKYAEITSYSTENSKHISTGDGGIVTTDNQTFQKK